MPGRRGPGPKPGSKPGPGASPAKRSAKRRKRRRRRVVVGGAVVLAGSHRSRKLKQQDVQQIEEHTNVSIEELEEEELDQAINELGIEEEPLTAEDEAAIASSSD